MTVTLNEAALKLLLDTQEGPVGQFVQGVALQVERQAQQNVRDYFHSAIPALTVDQDVDVLMSGSDALVGIKNRGRKSQRLAQLQSEGTLNWLTDALQVQA